VYSSPVLTRFKVVIGHGCNLCPQNSGGTTTGPLILTLLRQEPLTPKLIPTSTNSFLPPVRILPLTLPPSHPVEMYISFFSKHIAHLGFTDTFLSHHNLTTAERRAISNLRSDPTIIICPDDKGSTTVVMNYLNYQSEALEQLSDPTFYRPLEEDPTQSFLNRIRTYLSLSHARFWGLSPPLVIPADPQFPVVALLLTESPPSLTTISNCLSRLSLPHQGKLRVPSRRTR